LLIGAVLTNVNAMIDAPLTGPAGSGWGDFGGHPADPSWPQQSQPDFGFPSVDFPGSGWSDDPGFGNDNWGGNVDLNLDPPIVDDGEALPEGEEVPLPDEEESEYEPVVVLEDDLEDPLYGIVFIESWIQDYQRTAEMWARQRAGSPTVTNITWGSGAVSDRIVFSCGRFIGSPLPRITFQGQPAFCYEWNEQAPGGNYHLGGEGTNPRIRQLLANFLASNQNREHYIATQILIWSEILGSSVASWGTSGVTQAHINAIANGTATPVSYIWFGGGDQNILIQGEPTIDNYRLSIFKRNTNGGAGVPGAVMLVEGTGAHSGFSQQVTTGTGGRIDVALPGSGVFRVTELQPPPGFLPPDNPVQYVTVTAGEPAQVTFFNEPEDGNGGDDDKYFRVEWEIEVVTETTFSQTTEVEYSYARGQLVIRKQNQDHDPLSGAVFDIRIDFADGSTQHIPGWTVDNGARLLTWTHPAGDRSAARVTVTEVVPPQHYTIDSNNTRTVYVNPSYTMWTIITHWEETVTTITHWWVVIEIRNGVESEVDRVQDGPATHERTRSEWNRQTHAYDRVGDLERDVLFVNQRELGQLIVYKICAVTGNRLANAEFRVDGVDLGNAGTFSQTGVTGSGGYVIFNGLFPGTYRVTEVRAPHTHNQDAPPQTVTIQSNETVRVSFVNTRRQGMSILKVCNYGNPLRGAVFEVRRGGGQVLGSFVTDENGLILIPPYTLTFGTYIVEEIQAPEGFLIDQSNNPQEIFVDNTQPNRVYSLVFRNFKMPSIEIIKVCESDPTVRLAGAVFRVTNTQTNQYWDVTTDANGRAYLPGLEIGTTYVVEETVPPPGFIRSLYRREIVLRENRVHTITVSNQRSPSLTIIKRCEHSFALLPGASFRVAWNNGAQFQDVTTGADGKAILTDLNVGWHTISELRAPDGFLLSTEPIHIYLRAGEESREVTVYNRAIPSLTINKICSVTANPLEHARFRIERITDIGISLIGEFTTDEYGVIFLEDIEPGRFRISELVPPPGFTVDRGVHEITISAGQRFVLTITNTPQAPILIRKINPEGYPLAGAEFTVTTMNGGHIATVQTLHTGYAIVPNVGPGWFVVSEIRSPEGHILSNTPQTIEVLPDGRPVTVTFINDRYPILQILKEDALDGRPLIGATFRITEANGRFIGEYMTDIDGLITFTDLPPGVYIVSEIRAASGYILDTTPQTVELRPNSIERLRFRNYAMPGLQLIKLCSETLRPVEGARFDVTELQNGFRRSLGIFTTGPDGIIFIPDLAPGHYILTEVRAAPGFILDPTPRTIFVEAGIINVVQVYNTPYANLRLLKICSESRRPLPDAVFRLFDERRREIGTFTTSATGEIFLPELPGGTYFLQEVRPPSGFLHDNTVRQVELTAGQLTTIEWPNTPLGSARIIKRCYHDSRPLYGVEFELLDARNNILGRFTTDQNGTITFNRNLAPGRYQIRETRAAAGYVLDERRHSFEIRPDETTEIILYNRLMQGRIQITKVAAGANRLTGDREGAPLSGAVFEIYNNQMELVDTIETEGRMGVATSGYLPLGVYGIIEVSSPDYFITDGEMFFAEIKIDGDLIQFRVLNEPVDLEVSVEKRGIAEVQPGDVMYYTISGIRNDSNVPLQEFYLRDILPTEAVRLQRIWTGVWSERVGVELQIRTNLAPNFRTVQRNLSSTTNNEIDVSNSALGLATNEFITEFRLVFGEVQPGFHETTALRLQVRVLESLENGATFTNRVDVGGRYNDSWVYDRDGWTTVVVTTPRGPLPQTGLQ